MSGSAIRDAFTGIDGARLGPVLLILVGGVLLGVILGFAVRLAIGRLSARHSASIEHALRGVGIRLPFASLAGRIVLGIVVLVAASEAARRAEATPVVDAFESASRIAPIVALGVGVLFAGVLAADRLAGLAGALAERVGGVSPALAETVVKSAVIVGASLVALDTVGVSTALPVAVMSLTVAAVLAIVAAAIVLASRGVLRNVAAARYVEEVFIEGDRVVFRDEPAEVESIGLLATEIVTDAGVLLRVPNHVFLSEVA